MGRVDTGDGIRHQLSKNNVGIDSPALLSSSFLLITVGFYGHTKNYSLPEQEAKELRYWALAANAKGRYSRGSSETLLDQDVSICKKGGGAKGLIERLKSQVGRLEIVPEDMEGRNQRSALFKTMFLAFRDAGAKDWKSQLEIAINHRGAQHRLQFHHIFPKAKLKSKFTTREQNDISNLAFIGGKTNRSISDKSPAEYFPAILEGSSDGALAKQCIPTDDKVLEVGAYMEFLKKRRELIAERLNEFLGA